MGACEVPGAAASVHYLPIPTADTGRIDAAMERDVGRMQVRKRIAVVMLGIYTPRKLSQWDIPYSRLFN